MTVHTQPMNAMLLAAGRGERMRPLTDTTPKPMLLVNGRPLIAWHLDALQQAGFRHVVINVAHLGQQIIDFVGDGQSFGLNVRFSVEPEGALETAGGIATAEPWRGVNGELIDAPFLVINADVWTDWPRRHAQDIRNADFQALRPPRCHLVLVTNPSHHPHGDFSLAPASENSARTPQAVTAPRAGHTLTFSGVGVYDRRMFDDIQPHRRAALAPLLHHAIAEGLACGSHYTGVWMDIGTPERLNELNRHR